MGVNKTNTYYGDAGKLLRGELDSLKVIEELLDMKTARAFTGGRGLADHFLTREVPAGI